VRPPPRQDSQNGSERRECEVAERESAEAGERNEKRQVREVQRNSSRHL